MLNIATNKIITQETTLMNYIFEIMQDGERWHEIKAKVTHCGFDKIRILGEIFFETDICDTETLKNKIYEYGSCLKENDHFGRELFVIMAELVK